MASTLCQKLWTIFCQKAQNFVWFRPYYFVQIPPACGPNTYQVMYGDTSNVSISNGNIKCPIGKSIFAVNLPLKLFRATVANADMRSLKSLHTFLKMFIMPVKFEQNCMVKTTRNLELFDKKPDFCNHFWQRVDAILEHVSVAEIIF